MSFNIEDYKTEHECDEHWDLRRQFMLAHKDTFPIDRLVCLAQVFINIEILGCRYPEETMRLVGELSQEVAAEYRERKKGKLKRTFVQASDAAETRAKGVKRSSHADLVVSDAHTSERQAKSFKTSQVIKFAASSETLHTTTPGPWQGEYRCFNESVTSQTSQSLQDTTKSYSRTETERSTSTFSGQIASFDRDVRDLLSKVIIIENTFHDSPASVTVTRSLQLNGFSTAEIFRYTLQSNGNTSCGIFVDNIELVSEECLTKADAREAASELLLEQMKEFCYTIEIKAQFVSETTVDTKYSLSGKDGNTDALPDDNLGNRLLRMMGWSGGGLGKNQQGIANPISVQEHINRSGLGHKDVKQELRRVLQNFARGDSENDLAFSSDFSKDERAVIHENWEEAYHLLIAGLGS